MNFAQSSIRFIRGASRGRVFGRQFMSLSRQVSVRPLIVPQYLNGSSVVSHVRCYSANAELATFLKDEIEAEKQIAKEQLKGTEAPTMPSFQVKTDEAEVTLTKSHGSETISVKFNVNHTVSSNTRGDMLHDEQQPESGGAPMAALPPFTIEVEKNGQKLTFECRFHGEDDIADEGESQEGRFFIDEVYMYSGEIADKVYAVSGDIMDGNLYEHLMGYLAERGFDDQFALNLMRFATHYEHAQYVNLLQKVRDFVSRK